MVSVYFGSIGCGKTTVACKLLRKSRKQYDHFFTTFKTLKLKNCHHWQNFDGLGLVTPPEHSLLVDDESGITYNNRKYKSMPQHTIEWYKLSRHYKCDVILMSQAFDDMDITLRRLASEYWYLRRVGPWTLSRQVYKYCMVDENTHQIIDGYRMASVFSAFTSLLAFILRPIPFLNSVFRQQWKLTFRPFYYKYFNSFWHPDLPLVEFE